jgi:hypothetical protein
MNTEVTLRLISYKGLDKIWGRKRRFYGNVPSCEMVKCVHHPYARFCTNVLSLIIFVYLITQNLM